jgi:hypothetical protein
MHPYLWLSPMPSRLTILLASEALVLGLLHLAADVRFDWFAFFDGGAELTVHALMARGLRPTLDFGYIYGLLPLLVGKGWYALFGLSPGSFAAMCVIGGALTAWGVARALDALRVGWIGIAWVVLAMPIGLISAARPSLTHVIEPIFLVHALADLAAGRRSRALALATACVFVKPSMAFLVAMTILAVMCRRDRPRAPRDWARLLFPAVAVFAAFAITLAAIFGSRVLVGSLLPIAGRAVYRANGFGFFGTGRPFWLPDRPRWAFYVDTLAGPWLATVVVLSLAAAAQVSRSRRALAATEGRVPEGCEVVIVCAILHMAFVVLFFGNRWSWVYYFPILVLGIAATSSRSRRGAVLAAILAATFLPSAYHSLRGPIEAWSGRSRSAAMYGLWASSEVRREWEFVLDRTRGRTVAVLATSDGAATLDERFEPPEVTFLVRGHVLPSEIARKMEQVRSAAAVIVANPAPDDPWFDKWPEFSRALQGHRQVWSCNRLRLYQRP